MIKKLMAFIMVLVLLCSLAMAPATAQALFDKTRTYTPEVFSDIYESEWFYSEIANCYAMGLVNGDGSGCFYPYELISRAEVITIAARVRSAYEKDAYVFTVAENEAWYAPYITYAIEKKIITAADFEADYNQPASRREVAYVYAKSLPYTEFRNINTSISAVPDVADTDPCYNQIVMLYRAGVVAGKDGSGRFSPQEYISRAEATAILNRVADPSQRISFTLADTNAPAGGFSAVEIAAQCSPAVFYIEIYNASGTAIASGSGFFISSGGLAVTNHHVIEDAYSAKVRLVDGTEYYVMGLWSYSEENDLALIQVNGAGFSSLEMGDSDTLKNGQTIYCVGSPLGLENTISEGLVSNSSREYDDVTYIQISAPISSGSSGGAVIDSTGKVIGVSSAGFKDGQNLNLAMPINLVKAMPTEHLISFKQFQGTMSTTPTPLPTMNHYPGTSIPDYGNVNGCRLRNKTAMDSGGYIYSYTYSQSDVNRYIDALRNEGFAYYNSSVMEGGVVQFYTKGGELVGIYVNKSFNEVWIAV